MCHTQDSGNLPDGPKMAKIHPLYSWVILVGLQDVRDSTKYKFSWYGDNTRAHPRNSNWGIMAPIMPVCVVGFYIKSNTFGFKCQEFHFNMFKLYFYFNLN